MLDDFSPCKAKNGRRVDCLHSVSPGCIREALAADASGNAVAFTKKIFDDEIHDRKNSPQLHQLPSQALAVDPKRVIDEVWRDQLVDSAQVAAVDTFDELTDDSFVFRHRHVDYHVSKQRVRMGFMQCLCKIRSLRHGSSDRDCSFARAGRDRHRARMRGGRPTTRSFLDDVARGSIQPIGLPILGKELPAPARSGTTTYVHRPR